MRIAFGVPSVMLPLVTALTRRYEVEAEGILPSGESLLEAVRLTRPDVVILSDSLPWSDGLPSLVAELQQLGPEVVVLCGPAMEADTWQGVKEQGVTLLQGASDEVVEGIARALSLPPRPVPGHMTLVPVNVKGGVGKSFLAVNLALAFKEADSSIKVMVLDSHPHGDVGPLLGINDGPTLADLFDHLAVAEGTEGSLPPPGLQAPKEINGGKLADFIQRHPSGVDLLVAPRRLGYHAPPGRELFRAVVRELKRIYHVLVIDTDTDLHLAPTVPALSLAEVILLVSTPEAMAVRGLLMVREVLEELGLLDRARIVLNKVRGPVDESELRRTAGLPVIARIPFDMTVLGAENRFRPVLSEGGKAASAVRELASRLLKEARSGSAG